MNYLIILFIIFFTTGCAGLKSSSVKDYIPSGSVLGVITVFDDKKASIVTSDNPVFFSRHEQDTANWRINKTLQENTEKTLTKNSFFRVKHIEYPLNELLEVVNKGHSVTELNVDRALVEHIQSVIKREQLDAVLFIYPTYLPSSSGYVSGYGLEQENLFGFTRISVYFVGRYFLFDVHSKKRFHGGTLTGEMTKDNIELEKQDILEVFQLGLEEALKPLYSKLKRHEFMSTHL